MSARTKMQCVKCGGFSSAVICHNCSISQAFLQSLDEILKESFREESIKLAREELIKEEIKKFRTLKSQQIKNEKARLKQLDKSHSQSPPQAEKFKRRRTPVAIVNCRQQRRGY